MRRVLRHILTATALLGVTTGQGNGLSNILIKPASTAKVAVSLGASVSISIPSIPTGNLLAGLGNVVNGVGGAVGGVVSGVGGAIAVVATPAASGVRNVVSGAAQIVSTVGDTANAAVVILPPVVSGVGNAATGLGNTVGITAIGATGLVGDLLDVTLGTVSDVVTSATFALLSSAPVQVADDLVGAILHPHPRDPKYRGWTYFGCFNPGLYLSTKATLKTIAAGVSINAKVCIDLCVQDSLDFATVRGNNCYCSNEAPGLDSGTDKNLGTDQCNILCTGSATELCGGSGTGNNAAVTVYKRVVSLIALPAPAYPSTNWAYSSCVYLNTWLALLTSTNSITSNPSGGTDGATCSAFCSTTSLAYVTAVVSGGTCYCSTLTISANLFAGIGECSTPCASKPNETCGGTSKLGASLAVAYTRRATPPTSTPPAWGATGPLGWKHWGCHYGAVYILDTILTGAQMSSLLDLTPDMSGIICVTTCKGKSYKYAMTIAGVCFCNSKAPKNDNLPANQGMCNTPCPSHPTERCGGEQAPSGMFGRSLVNIYGEDSPVRWRWVGRSGTTNVNSSRGGLGCVVKTGSGKWTETSKLQEGETYGRPKCGLGIEVKNCPIGSHAGLDTWNFFSRPASANTTIQNT
ncbi:hypothetical protein DE146DRAFT_740523 [Phaeosphaeria sp. MPI-PUGE-AT-0046c]|nr:hypothetical protein DE146DRAFT_740523 [Phaeosphaeria sp. MPI-PUGE-AT-0046c]